MYMTKKIADRRDGFTLVEMLVVIAIKLALAALAAAFAPRVADNHYMTRAVDNLEQWLLTAKMRARRDGLSTGLRFVQAPGDLPGTYSQFQYIQQPPPLSGGICVGAASAPPPPLPGVYQYPAGTGNYYTGGLLTSAGLPNSGAAGIVNFAPGSVDFTLGGTPFPNQWLVQMGDYLEINGGGVYQIGAAVSPPLTPANTLQLAFAAVPFSYDQLLSITTPTTNYRILRQPRILIGEEPLVLPNNYAVVTAPIPTTVIPGNGVPPNPTLSWSNVAVGSSGFPEVLFSPTGAVIGSNAGNGTVFITVYDTTMDTTDINSFASRIGVVAVQTRSGFIGAYGLPAGAGLPLYNPFYLAQIGRDSGL